MNNAMQRLARTAALFAGLMAASLGAHADAAFELGEQRFGFNTGSRNFGIDAGTLTAGAEYRIAAASANDGDTAIGYSVEPQLTYPGAPPSAAPAAGEPSSGSADDTPHADLSLAPGTAPAPVPERETHALLLIGLGLVGCIARRRGRGWRNRAVFDSPAILQTPTHNRGRLIAVQKMG
jgi:hypothetical protein